MVTPMFPCVAVFAVRVSAVPVPLCAPCAVTLSAFIAANLPAAAAAGGKAAVTAGTRKGRNVRKGFMLAGLAALAGCTSDPGFTGVSGVREATATEVLACTYISDISMRPSLYGPVLGQEALKYARNLIGPDEVIDAALAKALGAA